MSNTIQSRPGSPGLARLRFAILALAVTLGVGSGSAWAQSTRGLIELAYRWTQGETARYRVTESMTQEIVGERNATLQWEREFTYTERVIEADPETGAATIERVIDRVAIQVEGEGIDGARYDSEDPKTDAAKANPMIATFANMKGQTIRFSVDGDGHVTEVTGAVDLWSAALEGFAGTALAGALKGAAPEGEAMRKQIEAAMRLIPGRGVKIRESWEQSTPHATPIGTLTSRMEHTMAGFERSQWGRVARIQTTGVLSMGDQTDEISVGMKALIALAGIEIELGESSIAGQTLFDVENGRLVRQEMNITTEWFTSVKGMEGVEGLEGLAELAGDGAQKMMQTSVLERID
ncbi:MAG: hypothetical protein ACI89L_002473 [Phycisphaerales bacterium]|jgi:hypothetical protein